MPVALLATATTTPGTTGATTVTKVAGDFMRPGDLCVVTVLGKYNTALQPSVNQGFNVVRFGTGGTGLAGNDAGTVFGGAYAKILEGNEGTITVSPGAVQANSWLFHLATYRPGPGERFIDAIESTAPWTGIISDTTTASPLTGSVTLDAQPRAGDFLMAVGVIPTDLGTASGSGSFTATGLSGGSVGTGAYTENALGTDSAISHVFWQSFTGEATGPVTPSIPFTGATNVSGMFVVMGIRVGFTAPAVRVRNQSVNRAAVI